MARTLRMALDLTLLACQIIKDNMRVAWPYMKVECAPPMSISLLQGALGKTIESTASGVANGFMGAIRGQIKSMDAAVEKKKRDAEAAIIAAQEKVKAEEQKKNLEAQKKALDIKKKQEELAKQKDEKKAAEPAKKEDKKAPSAKKHDKKPPSAKKDEKKDSKKK